MNHAFKSFKATYQKSKEVFVLLFCLCYAEVLVSRHPTSLPWYALYIKCFGSNFPLDDLIYSLNQTHLYQIIFLTF